MVKDQYPDAVKEATGTVLPVWLDAFQTLLSVDPRSDVENTPNWDGLAIRIEVYKVRLSYVARLQHPLISLSQTLETIQTSFPRALLPHLRQLLSASLVHLSVLYPVFAQYYLHGTASVPRSSEDATIELIHLVCPVVDFVASIARSGKAQDWYEGDNLTNLIGAVLPWVQMTSDDVSCLR